ncbi:hypothetical protein P7K49_006352 [Saguinus oedipus]|uniref:Uncharacterized protein n=1 Tax=Saguinus oedipus TaxID=9490 RepID=A0ABQ9W265_SAGOE|nr:hypothetical protein P7K49_006352 [Saguinus oedipus]
MASAQTQIPLLSRRPLSGARPAAGVGSLTAPVSSPHFTPWVPAGEELKVGYRHPYPSPKNKHRGLPRGAVGERRPGKSKDGRRPRVRRDPDRPPTHPAPRRVPGSPTAMRAEEGRCLRIRVGQGDPRGAAAAAARFAAWPGVPVRIERDRESKENAGGQARAAWRGPRETGPERSERPARTHAARPGCPSSRRRRPRPRLPRSATPRPSALPPRPPRAATASSSRPPSPSQTESRTPGRRVAARPPRQRATMGSPGFPL